MTCRAMRLRPGRLQHAHVAHRIQSWAQRRAEASGPPLLWPSSLPAGCAGRAGPRLRRNCLSPVALPPLCRDGERLLELALLGARSLASSARGERTSSGAAPASSSACVCARKRSEGAVCSLRRARDHRDWLATPRSPARSPRRPREARGKGRPPVQRDEHRASMRAATAQPHQVRAPLRPRRARRLAHALPAISVLLLAAGRSLPPLVTPPCTDAVPCGKQRGVRLIVPAVCCCPSDCAPLSTAAPPSASRHAADTFRFPAKQPAKQLAPPARSLRAQPTLRQPTLRFASRGRDPFRSQQDSPTRTAPVRIPPRQPPWCCPTSPEGSTAASAAARSVSVQPSRSGRSARRPHSRRAQGCSGGATSVSSCAARCGLGTAPCRARACHRRGQGPRKHTCFCARIRPVVGLLPRRGVLTDAKIQHTPRRLVCGGPAAKIRVAVAPSCVPDGFAEKHHQRMGACLVDGQRTWAR